MPASFDDDDKAKHGPASGAATNAAGLRLDNYDRTSTHPALPLDDADAAMLDGLSPEEVAREEKRLVRKVDMRLVPAVWIMYLFSYLDRSNIGNAYTAGMGRDLNMSSTHYSVVLLVFFITYVLMEVPSNMVLTRVRPSLYLPALMFVWGGLSICFAAARSWQVIAVLRVLLGAIEAGFAPGVLFLLSSWYTKGELARRYALYYSAVAISGMLGGLIAGGLLQQLDGARGLAGWKWLFVCEGSATCFVALATIFVLPDFPTTTKWLTPRERMIATRRLQRDGVGSAQGGEDVSHTKAAKMAFTDWRTWAFVLTYMCTTGSQTIQYFIPELVKSMGYTGFHVQYMTAPIYACALVAILGFCFSSDLLKERAWHLFTASVIAVASFAIMLGVLDQTGRYVLLCFGVAAVYAACPLVSIYVSNAIPHPSEKRAVAQALVNALGNSASIYGSFLFPKNATDHNRMGFAVTMAFMCIAAGMALVLKYLLNRYPYPEIEQASAARGEDAYRHGETASYEHKA
ncbi:uncharacterized protein PFL1_04462 [Pseudozyma flocculosa PF-1]|uniref:Related to allantoate permease n=2 Tax=Pseudozyma flocculosa TaxID=84751 RepID=A0A5C3FE71_9BASI|nr:uncharacterized protein PFL1_04462 [Pseudozyma flocculosa PF-1]EPQ28135.1 hypothetical protein PFL1_04462 [Pseudozyma flocculosa PF-1]SPO41937.1 related to allantoate permease [Pseudozyma flocculosa]